MNCLNGTINGQYKTNFEKTSDDKAIQARARQKVFAFIRNRMDSSELVKTKTIMTYAKANQITPKQTGYALQELKLLGAVRWGVKTGWCPTNF